MVDIQDRRFLAQCTQHLSSASLAALLDLLLLHHPNHVVERKGGDSYHIDFGTLSPDAYALARKFIKEALKDDDEHSDALAIPETARIEIPRELTGKPSSVTVDVEKFPEELLGRSSSVGSLPMRLDSLTSLSSYPSLMHSSSTAAALVPYVDKNDDEEMHTEDKAVTNLNSTPSLAYPTASTTENSEVSPNSLNSMTVTPEKPSTRRKRARRASSDSASDESRKDDGARYYNGERIWRLRDQDKDFVFHGVPVVLLGLNQETQRPWVCTICKKTFVSKDKIVNHVQQHSGEKLHECKICHGKFSSKHYLKEHEKRVHLFDCHHCGVVFSSFEDLHEHALKEHPDVASSKGCSCKKGCNNSRCGCFKNGLNCTSSCSCRSCNNRV